jgi:hypothetical protein
MKNEEKLSSEKPTWEYSIEIKVVAYPGDPGKQKNKLFEAVPVSRKTNCSEKS